MTLFGPERFSLHPNRQKVFGWLGCDRDIPCRRAFERAWEPAAAALMECVRPQAAVARGVGGAMTVFLTLGTMVGERITAHFRRQEYVAGSLMNTMSDELLFQMDGQAAALVSAMLRAERVYASARLEPGIDLTADAQRRALLPVQKAIPFAKISDTGVIYPTKSMMYVITVSDQPCRMDTLHDCASCGQRDCVYRETPVQSDHFVTTR